ncbi:MAG: acyl carrier protein [Lachnospiraceae bacterium]|nr:acyl carrier protein [Lachnospiraceae bacterium]
MEDLLEILRDLHPDIDFEKEEGLIDDGILDSFDIVTLISEISENFDVTISAEYIVPENFNSAQAIYALIEKLEEED